MNMQAWNSDFEDMLCYTGRNTLNIKTGDFDACTRYIIQMHFVRDVLFP